MHLRKVPRSIRRCRFRQALLNPSVSNSHNFPLKKSRTAGCLSRCKLSHRGALTATRERATLSHQTPERQSPDWRVTVGEQQHANQEIGVAGIFADRQLIYARRSVNNTEAPMTYRILPAKLQPCAARHPHLTGSRAVVPML